MASADATTFQYELNACLAACRAVTSLVAAELKRRTPGFRQWWKDKLAEFESDDAAKFFVKLRDYSLHQGKIGVVGAAVRVEGGARWTYRFAATQDPVPVSLWGRDVSECCHEHIRKLSALVLECAEAYPFHACPRTALSSLDGLRAVGVGLDEVDEVLGLPKGWTDVMPEGPIDDRLSLLARRVDGLNFEELRRLANYISPTLDRRDLLLDRIAARIDARSRGSAGDAGDPVLASIFERIQEIEAARKK